MRIEFTRGVDNNKKTFLKQRQFRLERINKGIKINIQTVYK